MQQHIPIITVDGPSGSGKGTLSRLIARHLGWHFLDSGALYRLLALAALNHGVALDNHAALVAVAAHLDVIFEHEEPPVIRLEKAIVTHAIRTEECGAAASTVAAIPAVRAALLERQRAFKQAPGLVADGRDMGTVVFPEAELKLFLEASARIRAKRRQLQLKEQNIDVSLDDLFDDIEKRDARDRQRAVSPLVPAEDAIILDSSDMTIQEVLDQALELIRQRQLGHKK